MSKGKDVKWVCAVQEPGRERSRRWEMITLRMAAPEMDAVDMEFAERAAIYLDRQGLDADAIVRCLMEELELDRNTAEAVASLAA